MDAFFSFKNSRTTFISEQIFITQFVQLKGYNYIYTFDLFIFMSKFVSIQNMSTPYNACQHMGEALISRSALATVNGQIWDMHR